MKEKGSGYLCLLNTVILFSTFEVVSKTLIGRIDPFQINFIRFFTGGLLLFLFTVLKGDAAINVKDLSLVAVTGIINVAISMNLLQLSLYADNAKASVVAVIFSSNPIFVTVFAALIDKGKISLYKFIGLSAGMSGIIVVFSEKIKFNSVNFKSPLLALLSAVFFGLYTVIGRKASVRIGSLKMNSYSFITGSMVLLPFLLIFKIPVARFDYSGIYQVIYLSAIVTGFAYLTYFKGLAVVGAGNGSLVFFIKPVLASVIAILFLKEHASLNLFAGTALIIAGILTVIYSEALHSRISKKTENTYFAKRECEK